MKRSILFFTAALALLIGCAGYRLGNIPRENMKDVETIYVPVVKNESYEPGLSVMTTNAILREMDNDGTYTSARQKEADAVLEVSIKEMTRKPMRRARTDVQIVDEYEVTLVAQATLTNLQTGERVFTNQEVIGKSHFFVHGNLQEAERQAMPSAADDLARRLIDLVSEGW